MNCQQLGLVWLTYTYMLLLGLVFHYTFFKIPHFVINLCYLKASHILLEIAIFPSSKKRQMSPDVAQPCYSVNTHTTLFLNVLHNFQNSHVLSLPLCHSQSHWANTSYLIFKFKLLKLCDASSRAGLQFSSENNLESEFQSTVWYILFDCPFCFLKNSRFQ